LAECAQKLAPGLVDRYLAATGYKAQQISDEPESGDRPDNLFEPVSGDPGTHGAFSDRAYDRSPQLWANEHRGWLLLSAGIAAGALLMAVVHKRQ
jgi:hypothetical protein